MANKNITFSSNPGYGYTLTRTSYDVRQEINAKVIGVLKSNNETRKKLLNRNIGKYELYQTDEGIGYISNLYSNEDIIPKTLGTDGILGYTHVYESDYQKLINHKYDIGDLIQYYKHGSLPDGNNLKWFGLYDDYTKYIDEVYGFNKTALNFLGDLFKINDLKKDFGISSNEERTLTIQSILNDFLQYDNIKYAMEKTRIGTITPNPLASLSGSITTNINNFSGKDTRLGLITNHIYAHTLKNGAQFNSLRKTRYITPDVYEYIGNKLSTISTLGSDFRIDDETGRLAFELHKDNNKIMHLENLSIDDFASIPIVDMNRDIAYTENARYRNLMRNDDHYLPFIGKRYYPIIHYNIKLLSNENLKSSKRNYSVWNEGDGSFIDNLNISTFNETYKGIEGNDVNGGLLKKTYELFDKHDKNGIDTLVGRFHTSGNNDRNHNEVSLFQTAVTSFGMSHGRNLLTKNAYYNNKPDYTNGYSNPYCRTWTYHHEYDSIDDLIRPFSNKDENGNVDILEIDELQENWWMYGRRKGSASRLKDNTVLNRNGFVNITPTIETDEKLNVDVRKCMFSIENLAWKDITRTGDKNILSKEQTGPNGGRIMWFPPYDLKFNEQIGVNWNQVDFIGRGEKIYTYTNTERSGTLSFILLVDHPSVLDMWKNNGKKSDNDDDNEQNILRFFAGCDTLELDNVQKKPKEDIVINKEPKEIPLPIIDEDISTDIVFYIFFPNNYSGQDGSELDNAVNYIANEYESDRGGNYTTPIYENYKWAYRVDTSFIDEKMYYNQSYNDLQNFYLNKKLEEIKKHESFNDATTSFQNISINSKSLLDGMIIEEAIVQGFASSHGTVDNNLKLQNRRADFAKKFLSEKLGIKNIKKIDGGTVKVDDIDKKNTSGNSAKRARCAKIILKAKKIAQKISVSDMTTENTSEGVNIMNKIDSVMLQKHNQHDINEFDGTNVIENSKKEVTKTFSNSNVVTGSKKIVNEKETIEYYDNFKGVRWDEEAQYFSMLKENDSFLYKRIVDKINYFMPAYHSITPEGFNARLGFLHQCTRQGTTNSVSDVGNSLKSAGNLAFGRPPICVLRIGDFYHTRIIIDSITINYEDSQWDMNPEGIGMQPMFARISLNFKFLGGSDIEAPISRLQNAISFNYYANQSIYDDRADMGMYKDGKAVIKGKPWNPIINNK